MTVDELIEKLQEMNGSAGVVVLEDAGDEWCHDVRAVESDDSGSFVILARGGTRPVYTEGSEEGGEEPR